MPEKKEENFREVSEENFTPKKMEFQTARNAPVSFRR